MKNLPGQQMKDTCTETNGYCRRCHRPHKLPKGKSGIASERLMRHLERTGLLTIPEMRIIPKTTPTTASLFGEAGGKMFGVLECLSPTGEPKVLYAFSGQYEKKWLIEGWAPPLFDIARFDEINIPREREIKALSHQMAGLTPQSDDWLALRAKRKTLSQDLMQQIFDLYEVRNFRGESAKLRDAFLDERMPTGTGDCCAPKLLNLAAETGLIPVGLSEFYWGRTNNSATRRRGFFYPPCAEKCRPLLGFMLCGIEELHGRLREQ